MKWPLSHCYCSVYACIRGQAKKLNEFSLNCIYSQHSQNMKHVSDYMCRYMGMVRTKFSGQVHSCDVEDPECGAH